jgi:hypothetical protein
VNGLENEIEIGRFVCMETIEIPVAEARADLPSSPWRVEKPDDPARYGDMQSPVLEEWE